MPVQPDFPARRNRIIGPPPPSHNATSGRGSCAERVFRPGDGDSASGGRCHPRHGFVGHIFEEITTGYSSRPRPRRSRRAAVFPAPEINRTTLVPATADLTGLTGTQWKMSLNPERFPDGDPELKSGVSGYHGPGIPINLPSLLGEGFREPRKCNPL